MTIDELRSLTKLFAYYKSLGEKAFAQVDDTALFAEDEARSNSIATIVNHLHGNMLSRWTDFLTTDGEKEWRHRDLEFENDLRTRADLMRRWEEGWSCVFDALGQLAEADLSRTVYIRQQAHTVPDAIHRQLAHYAYHVGQIVYLGKLHAGAAWTSLSIPRGGSDTYNAKKADAPDKGGHFTDEFTGEKP